MKRTKIVLGVSVLFLSIAGATTAKLSHFGNSAGYFLTSHGVLCKKYNSPCFLYLGLAPTCTTIVGESKLKVYTDQLCLHPLHYLIE